jgi:hypothetical protein
MSDEITIHEYKILTSTEYTNIMIAEFAVTSSLDPS